MIGLTVKNIIIKKQLKFFSKFLVFYFVLFSTTVSMRIGWFTDVPPSRLKDFLDTVNTVVLTGYWKQLIIFLFDIQCMFQSGSECGPWTKIIGNSCLVIHLTKYDRINCKKYHNQETTEKKFQSSWCSILYYFRGLSQCGLAGLLMCPLNSWLFSYLTYNVCFKVDQNVDLGPK
jgi:hypothetical protein